MDSANFFCSFTTSPRVDLLGRLPEPKSPKNYKKDDAIREFVDKAKGERADLAAKIPNLSRLTAVTVINSSGVTAISVSRDQGADVAASLVDFLTCRELPEKTLIWGFDVGRMMQTCLIECYSYNSSKLRDSIYAMRDRVQLMDLCSDWASKPRYGHEQGADLLTPEVLLLSVGLIVPTDLDGWAMAALNYAHRCCMFR